MIQADARASATRLGPAIDALNRDIRALKATQWDEASSCQGWLMSDLVAHVVRNGWSMLQYIQRTLASDPTPTFGPTVMHIQDEVKAAGPQAAADRQERENTELVKLVQGLSDEQLSVVGTGHPMGPRPNNWAPTQRLIEVVYHHWDLRHSAGYNGPLDNDQASYLLTFMLDPGRPPTIALPPAKDGAGDQTFRLTASDGGHSWRVQGGVSPFSVLAEGDGPADVVVTAESGWLALALYGRASVDSASFSIGGGSDAVGRFKAVFGG